MPGNSAFSKRIKGDWDPPRSDDYPSEGNLISSAAIYGARFVRAGTLIFLYGGQSGCCLQSLTIYRVTAKGVEKYFASDEFAFTQTLRPLPAEVTILEGIESLVESVGSFATEVADATAYQPTLVIRLEEQPRIDIAESKRRTKARLGGFAGLKYREDVLAVTGTDGTHYLWDEKRRRRLQ